MAFTNPQAKLYLLVLGAINIFLAVWLFIAIAVHISSSIGSGGGAGVGGRVGFGHICHVLFNLALWAVAGFLAFTNKFTTETWSMLLSATAVWGVVIGWIWTFEFYGTAHQLVAVALNVLSPSDINGAFTGSANAAIAASSLQLVVSIAFVALLVVGKAAFLNQNPDTPQQPADLGYVPQNDQATYYNPGQPPPPDQAYNNYAAPQQDNGVYN